MVLSKVPDQGDVYWVDKNTASDKEMKDRHRFVVITPQEINSLGISMAVPILTAEAFSPRMGLTVRVKAGYTTGMAVCNQVRSFDIQTRVQMDRAGYVESLDKSLVSEIVSRVLSVIEPSAG